MTWREDLIALGIASPDAEELATRIERSPPSTTAASTDSTENVRPTKMALVAALVAARDSRRFGDALRILLQRVGASQADLSPFDAGRYWHLRGFFAWRVEGDAFASTRALNHAVRLLQAIDDESEARSYRARVHDTFGQLLQQQGMLLDARREYEESLALRDPENDRMGMAITLGNLGRLCIDVGDYANASDYLRRDLALVDADESRVRALLLAQLADCSIALGSIDEAHRMLDESSVCARASGDAIGEAFVLVGRARAMLRGGGRVTEGLAMASEALERISKADMPNALRAELRATARSFVASAKAQLGDREEALAEYVAARADLESAPAASPMQHAELLCGMAELQEQRGAVQEGAVLRRAALRWLDGTAADELRQQVEAALRERSYDSWLVHAAGRFIGQKHIEFLLGEAGRGGFRGARRHVLVLFSDIRGFTTLSERLAPDELIVLLNDFLTQMTRCIEHHGGMVDKFIGDAVMAIFPVAPESKEATAGIRAALAMQAELERFNRRLEPSIAGAGGLSIGIGLHVGDVVAGLIGSPQKREYTVIGDVVNTASRLESMTKQLGVSILVTDAVVEQSDVSDLLVRPLGRFAPKGRRAGVAVLDLAGERDGSPAAIAMAREIDRAETALRRFNDRAFADAARLFADLANDTRGEPREIGYARLEAEARELEQNPPNASWRGEIALTDK